MARLGRAFPIPPHLGKLPLFGASPAIIGTLAEVAQAATVAFVVTNTPPAITCTLAEAGQAATVALVATNTPPAITGTLAEVAQAATVAFVATNTPPAITGTLAEAGQAATESYSALTTSGNVCTLAEAGQAATVAFVATNTPPAITGTLAEVAQAATVAFVATNTPPAITGTLAEAGQAATVAFVATNTPPAITGTLAEAGQAATVALVGTVFAGNLATLAAVAAPATMAFVATIVQPPITGTLAEAAAAATMTFVVTNATITGSNLEQVIVSAMRLDSAMVAIVGQRIYPIVVPQTGLIPALSYRIQSTGHDSTLTGATGMRWTRVRFEFQSHAHSDVDPAREVVRNRFQGLIGPLGPIMVLFCEMESEVDGYDQPMPGNDNGIYWKRMDFRFKTRETLPTHS